MSDDALQRWASVRRSQIDAERDAKLSPQELAARRKIVEEAEVNGATLVREDARGGLPPSLVLGALRKSEFRCQGSGCISRDRIGPHHRYSKPRGRVGQLDGLVILCAACHGKAHS